MATFTLKTRNVLRIADTFDSATSLFDSALFDNAGIEYTLKARNSSSFALRVRHGQDPRIYDIQNKTFTDILYPDGTLVKDATFSQLQAQSWTNKTRN